MQFGWMACGMLKYYMWSPIDHDATRTVGKEGEQRNRLGLIFLKLVWSDTDHRGT